MRDFRKATRAPFGKSFTLNNYHDAPPYLQDGGDVSERSDYRFIFNDFAQKYYYIRI
jgi:hypothetical protein